MKKFIKKQWSNILLGLFLILFLIPQTRMPIQVFIQRLIAFSPSTIEEKNQKQLSDYNLIIENKNAENLNLSSSQGKVILINFWATWCPPCVAEMPDFKALYADYKNKVEFYFITQDSWSLIDKFESKRNYNLPYYRLIQPNTAFNYQQLPTTYLIDTKGNIIIEKTGIAQWNSDKFRTALNEILLQ